VPVLLDALAEPAAIVLAPTGMVPTREMTPHVPLQPAEIAADVARAMEVGITAVHLHARDTDDTPTWKRYIYADIISRVREVAPDLPIAVSTSGRAWSDLEKRADVLSLTGDVKPDVASLTLSSMNFIDGPSVNAPETIRALARIMKERGITPELEVFDLGMLNFARVLRKEGLLVGLVPANLFFGNIAGMQPTLIELAAATSMVPDDVMWCGAGIGVYQGISQLLSVAAAGGVRVGLEDGIHLDRTRTQLATNVSLVERTHRMLELAGRRMMTPNEYRQKVLAQ
jgi:uncharacterized protein (DUF849 family)